MAALFDDGTPGLARALWSECSHWRAAGSRCVSQEQTFHRTLRAAQASPLEHDEPSPTARGPAHRGGPGTGKTRTLVERIAAWYTAAPPRRMRITPSLSRARQRRVARSASPSCWARALAGFGADLHAPGLDLLRAHAAAAGCRRTSHSRRGGSATLLAQGTRRRRVRAIGRATRRHLGGQGRAGRASRCSTRTGGNLLCRMKGGSPARAGLTSTIWWLVPSACWKRTKAALASAHRRCRHLLVDDNQDINAAQYRLVRLLAPRVLQRICAPVAIPISDSSVLRGRSLLFRPFSPSDYPGARTLDVGATIVLWRRSCAWPPPSSTHPGSRPTCACSPISRAEAKSFARCSPTSGPRRTSSRPRSRRSGGTSFPFHGRGPCCDGHGLAFHQIRFVRSLPGRSIEEALDQCGIPCHRRGDDAFSSLPHVATSWPSYAVKWIASPQTRIHASR